MADILQLLSSMAYEKLTTEDDLMLERYASVIENGHRLKNNADISKRRSHYINEEESCTQIINKIMRSTKDELANSPIIKMELISLEDNEVGFVIIHGREDEETQWLK